MGMCNELTAASGFPITLCCFWGGGTGFGREVKPWKKGGVKGTWFKTWFYTSLPYSDLLVNKSN